MNYTSLVQLGRQTVPALRAAVIALIGLSTAAHAQNLVNNGNFAQLGNLNSTSSQITAGTPSTLPGWNGTVVGTGGGITCVMITNNPSYTGNATPLCGTSYATVANTGYNYGTLYSFPGAPPGGGNVLAADSSSTYQQSISQTISNLTVGASYTLSFYQSAAQQNGWTGATTDQWDVSFLASGSTCASYSPIPSSSNCQASTLINVPLTPSQQSSIGWASQTMIFTATATSQTLTFLASGTPASDPPFALLGDVTLTKNVPEPAALSVFSVCLAGLGALRWARRRALT